MYYVNELPNESGNYGNPVSKPYNGAVAIPDMFLTTYLDSMGFVNITVDQGVVDSVVINQEAYDAYIAEHQQEEDEKWKADRDYEPGEYLTNDGTLYKVILPIFAGARITIGTNAEATTLEAVLAGITEEG